MRSLLLAPLAGALLILPVAASAAAGSFTLVNGTQGALTDISISRFGSNDWSALGVVLPGPRTRVTVNFSNPDCAFDIRAKLSTGGSALWRGVNLCEVKAVILHREQSGELWVDYD